MKKNKNNYKKQIEALKKTTDELERTYILYNNMNTLEKRSYWKAKWYKALYGIKSIEVNNVIKGREI